MAVSLDDVYRKFGETAEAAQLLDTELGTMLLTVLGGSEGLIANPNPKRAAEILDQINAQTLGQLLSRLKSQTTSLDDVEALLLRALDERNRLAHSFYRQHNLRRNSDQGRAIMMEDLKRIHDTVLNAYKTLMLLSGVDIEAMAKTDHVLPTGHFPI